MYTKTAAIVLHLTKYSDTSNIVHLYTEHFGRTNYIVNGTHAKKSANKAALFAPLSIIEVEIAGNPTQDLQRIRESRLLLPFKTIPFDFAKQAIVLFLAEVLYRTLKQPIENEELFTFLEYSIRMLDGTMAPANFHPVFLMQLSKYIGFFPNLAGKGLFFDMESGETCYQRPLHPHFLDSTDFEVFKQICHCGYNDMMQLHMNRNQRTVALNNILQYYTLHVPEFYEVQSMEVLNELFD